MKTDPALTQEHFDALLEWLAADRDEAARLYEKIREGLINYFQFRGCIDAPALADETVNRVARKVGAFDHSKNVKIVTYFQGFAGNVLNESRRAARREVALDGDAAPPLEQPPTDRSKELRDDCLENCLGALPPAESDLVVRYYAADGNAKFAARRALAAAFDLKMPALHTKVFRLRGALRQCVEKCVRKNNV